MLIDYHVHALGHRGGFYTEELLDSYFRVAQEKGIYEVGLTDHDEYIEKIDPEAILKSSLKFSDLRVKLGLEVDYWPGREQEIRELTRLLDFDYLIGSIHFVDGWGFDNPAFLDGYNNWDINELYTAYYGLVKRLAVSKLFDIVGHLDLIKVFGYYPTKNRTSFAEDVLKTIRDNALVVEVNTSGLYKPCCELYPSADLLTKCYELNIPVTMGSDAHDFSDVGRNLAQVREMLLHIGYRRIAVFFRRKVSYVNL